MKVFSRKLCLYDDKECVEVSHITLLIMIIYELLTDFKAKFVLVVSRLTALFVPNKNSTGQIERT